MKNTFNMKARDKAAKEYLASKEFLESARYAIKYFMINQNYDYAAFYPGKDLDSRVDMPYLQQAFQKLKKEYPKLDNIHLQDHDDEVVIDTKPDTFLRRLQLSVGF